MGNIYWIVFPLAASFLFLMVFRRAGFGVGMQVLCIAPLLGAALPWLTGILIYWGVLFDSEMASFFYGYDQTVFVFLSVIGQLLGILPLVLLAVSKWPNLPPR